MPTPTLARRAVGVVLRLAVAALLALAALWWARHAPGAEGRTLATLPFGRHLAVRDLPAVAVLGGAAFLAVAAAVPRSPLLRPVLASLVGAVAVWWWLAEPLPEGPVYLTFSPGQGFSLGDVPGAALMAVGVLLGCSACWSVLRRVGVGRRR